MLVSFTPGASTRSSSARDHEGHPWGNSVLLCHIGCRREAVSGNSQYTYIPTYLLHWLPICLPTYLPTYLLTYILTSLHTYLCTYVPTYLCTYLPTYLPNPLPAYLISFTHFSGGVWGDGWHRIPKWKHAILTYGKNTKSMGSHKHGNL